MQQETTVAIRIQILRNIMSNSDMIKLVKLTTGEEILCKVTPADDTGKKYAMNNCVAVVLQPGPMDPSTGKQQMSFGFLPWATMAKDGIVVGDNHIMYMVEPDDEILAHYNKIFSPLAIPPKSLVLPR
jgi:hypothetical protein